MQAFKSVQILTKCFQGNTHILGQHLRNDFPQIDFSLFHRIVDLCVVIEMERCLIFY